MRNYDLYTMTSPWLLIMKISLQFLYIHIYYTVYVMYIYDSLALIFGLARARLNPLKQHHPRSLPSPTAPTRPAPIMPKGVGKGRGYNYYNGSSQLFIAGNPAILCKLYRVYTIDQCKHCLHILIYTLLIRISE